MKLIYRDNIDTKKWDDLVKGQHDSSAFSLTAYLDSVSENWCVLTDEHYSKGIAIPFIIRAGIKICYTPIFVRYLEFFGEKSIDLNHLIEQLKSEFKQGQLNLNMKAEIKDSEKFVYQTIHKNEDFKMNSQASRMISKFEKSGLKLHDSRNTKYVLDRIDKELPQKIAALDSRSINNLEKLVEALKEEELLSIIEVKDQDETVGGIFLVEFNDRFLYLKGAFTAESKKNGAMYATMKYAIEMAKEKGLNFDFGGSRVEGVRRFNVNLGGKDQFYSSIHWDNTPIWFKIIKKLNQAWKRK